MRKNLFIPAFCSLFILTSLLDLYGQTGEVYKVGISVWTGYPTSVKGFKEAMAEGGLIEGKNAKYLYGKSGLNQQKQHEIAQGFKAAKEGDMSGIAGDLDILRRRFEAVRGRREKNGTRG